MATDVAARGIHVDGIAHVVNFDLPQVPEDFIHRVGRTGRAGVRGTASTFHTRNERSEIRRIERTIKTKLDARQVPADLPQEDRSLTAATVISMPVPASRPPAKHHRPQGHPAAFTTRRRAMRAAR